MIATMLRDVNWLRLMWIVYTAGTLVSSVPLMYFPRFIPNIWKNLFFFGKLHKGAGGKGFTLVRWLKVPKRYFSHFYVLSSFYTSFLCVVMFSSYYKNVVPKRMVSFLDAVAGSEREAKVDSVATIVVMVLFLTQILRRAYECLFVSVFSPGVIYAHHYIIGITFYLNGGTALLAEAHGFTSKGFDDETSYEEEQNWNWSQLLGTSLYFWAAWHQFKCSKILANLRKNSTGEVVTTKHKIPMGDWFSYVSCSHFLAEILVYIALNIILKFNNSIWLLMLLFTAVNQATVALFTHKWYLEHLKDYPTDRKAIFPFIL